MDPRVTQIEASLKTLLPNGVEFALAEKDAAWIATVTRAETMMIQEVGSGATALEAAEKAQRDLMLVLGALALFESVTTFLKRRGSTADGVASPPRSGLLADVQPSATATSPETLETGTLAERIGGFGWRFVFDAEPDGSFRWWVLDSDGQEIMHDGEGTDWDDAKLNAILRLLPPSAEGRARSS